MPHPVQYIILGEYAQFLRVSKNHISVYSWFKKHNIITVRIFSFQEKAK